MRLKSWQGGRGVLGYMITNDCRIVDTLAICALWLAEYSDLRRFWR